MPMNSDGHNPDQAETLRTTYRYDLWRGAFRGTLSVGATNVGLFVVIRHFNADETIKSLVASAPFIGMFLSVFLVHYFSRTGMKKSLCGALPVLLAAICLFLSAAADSVYGFAGFLVVGFIAVNSMIPFLTSIYSDNYPEKRRGKLFSRPLILTVSSSIIFSYTAAALLDWNMAYYREIFVFLGFCALGKAYAVYCMPSQPIEKEKGNHKNPLGNYKYIFLDPSFGWVLFSWFIMGFANLWTLPLRVEYIASSAYGIEGTALLVAALTTVVPETFRLLFTDFWAKLFDRMNFIVLRMTINIFFALGVGLFFLTANPWIIALGSAFIGMAFGGGSIAWGLWVTKYAPPGKAAAYMSVHVSLTGVRGILGPALGYWMLARVGPQNIGLISAGMMLLATLMLIPEIKKGAAKN